MARIKMTRTVRIALWALRIYFLILLTRIMSLFIHASSALCGAALEAIGAEGTSSLSPVSHRSRRTPRGGYSADVLGSLERLGLRALQLTQTTL